MSTRIVRRWPQDVPVHPAAELFPLMAGEDFAELVCDIRQNGLHHPIIRTADEEIIDGRNRFLACVETDTPVRYVTYTGDPWSFAIGANLHRRHLTDTQRAVIAGKLADRARGGSDKIVLEASDEALSHRSPTRHEAAEWLQVSKSAVDRARRVDHHGTEALTELLHTGRVSLSTADTVATTWTPEEQDEFAAKVAAGEKPIALVRARNAADRGNSVPVAPEAEPDDDGWHAVPDTWVPAGSDRGPKAAARRREAIRELAGKAWTSVQIGEKLGIRPGSVRRLAASEGVAITADEVMGVRTNRTIDSNRIVRETVNSLEGLDISLGLIDYSELDPAELQHWTTNLTKSIRVLNLLNRKLKEMIQCP